MIIQTIDGIDFKLKELYDFSWLSNYGRVFKVFDENDSGNIGFGVEGDMGLFFIKYAGAQTINAGVEVKEAIKNLKKAEQVYTDLKHPSLIEFVDSFKREAGYGLVFKWHEGYCMNDHWEFEGRLPYTGQENYLTLVKDLHPESPTFKMKHLPMNEKLRIYREILDFHQYVISVGYVAVDFYDGSIMYDFESGKLTICDIDLYRKAPVVNDMGRMWGSSRFMSPEEFALGETLDERTNTFNIGAFAFFIFGDARIKDKEHWQASDKLYEFAAKSISVETEARYQSFDEMIVALNKVMS